MVVRSPSVGKREIRFMPDTPPVNLLQLSDLPTPSEVTTPMPVTATTGRPSLSRLGGSANIVGKGAAETIVFDLADKGCARTKPGDADNGIRRRAARRLDGRTHRVVDRLGARRVDQRHRAFVHAVLEQKIFFSAGGDVNDRVADAKNVVTCGCHTKTLFEKIVAREAHYSGRPLQGKARTCDVAFAF